MAATTSTSEGLQQIPIDQLPIQQLDQFKKQLGEEINILTESLNSLGMAQKKFRDSLDNLEDVSSENHKKEILVPMTTSMYVPGVIDCERSVIVDVGTGYYIEKTVEAAKKYFRRKIEFIGEQVEKIHPALQEKQKVRAMIMEAYTQKLSQQMAAQKIADK